MKNILILLSLTCLLFTQGCLSLIVTRSGLAYQDQNIGTGAIATSGKTVEVHYSGWLNEDGKKGKMFDSSIKRGVPFTFILGEGDVISGWDEGVTEMRVGGKRTLYIPPHLGYGYSGSGRNIPGNAHLIFDIELLKVH